MRPARAVAAILLAPFVLTPMALASHAADAEYDLPLLRQIFRQRLDVVIVPPGHGQVYNGHGVLGGLDADELDPYANSYMRAVLDATDNWQRAIQRYAPAWLKEGLAIDVRVAGVHPLPDAREIDILVVSDEHKGTTLGVAITVNQDKCIVDNSKLFTQSFTYNDMYNIHAQEFGHCLGLDHVVDDHPAHDVMNGNYPYAPGARTNPKNCVSNLDVKGLEGVFGAVFQQHAAAGKPGKMPAATYAQWC